MVEGKYGLKRSIVKNKKLTYFFKYSQILRVNTFSKYQAETTDWKLSSVLRFIIGSVKCVKLKDFFFSLLWKLVEVWIKEKCFFLWKIRIFSNIHKFFAWIHFENIKQKQPIENYLLSDITRVLFQSLLNHNPSILLGPIDQRKKKRDTRNVRE